MYAFYSIAGAAIALLFILVVLAAFSTLSRMYTKIISKMQDQITDTREDLARTQAELNQTQNTLKDALKANAEVNERLKVLESARVAKMNHGTYSALMEAMAFLNKAIWEDDLEIIQEEQDHKKHKAQRQYLEYARAKLLEARDGRKDTRK